jgi:hypothetical protein
MFAAVLAISMGTTSGVSPDRAPIGERNPHVDVRTVYNQLTYSGLLQFRTSQGRTEIFASGVQIASSLNL